MDPIENLPQSPHPSVTGDPLAKPAFDQADFQKRLSDEYKMLQDKIDKIGAFRFTIKGWAVAIVGVVSAATSSAVIGSLVALGISVALAAIVVLLFILEVEQVRLSLLFATRAKTLEHLFRSIDRGRRPAAPPPIPFTAHEIGRVGYQRLLTPRPKRWRADWAVSRYAHRPFYVVLLVLTTLPVIRHGDEIGRAVNSRAAKFIDAVRAVKSQEKR